MKKGSFSLSFRKSLGLYSWALYDFANTIFSAVVLTFYFPLYLTDLTGRNVDLGISTTLAMVLAGLAVPWLGALSDRTGKTKTYLIFTTFLCVGFTACLSLLTDLLVLMPVFLLACFFFHASLVFYNALLPVAAERGKEGFASGLGTGLGYLGVLFSIPIAHVVDSLFGRRFVFLSAAILFLVFALPLFLWVPERKVENPQTPSVRIFLESWQKAFQMIRKVSQNRVVGLFFAGNFLVVEAMNAVIFWLVVYMARVFHPPQAQLIAVFLALNFSAFVFGLAAGPLTDRWGSRKTLLAASAMLSVTLLMLGLTQNFLIFTVLGCIGGGAAFAGIWTAGRKRVVELASAKEVGVYFGLYNLTTKVSVASSLLFSILADQWGYRPALLSLTLPSIAGFLLLISSRSSASLES